MMSLAVLSGVLLSAIALLWLARRDPKRLRVLGQRRAAATPMARRLATLVVLTPGGILLFCGQWAELLIWLGAVLALGWLLTQIFAVRDQGHVPET